MKIGFDAKRAYQNFTGLGNYSRDLIENLIQDAPENQYVLLEIAQAMHNRTLLQC